MKVLVAAALIGFAAVFCADSEVPPAEPENFKYKPVCHPPQGPEEVIPLLPNPDNCTTYFVCNTGIPILMPCPAGLHFNNKAQVCDYPMNACCDPAYDPHNKCNKFA